jgi:ribonuclease-3
LIEAVIGAILIDGGVTPARVFVRRHVMPKSSQGSDIEVEKDAKTALLHYCQHHKLGQPRYNLIDTVGLQHEQEFVVRAHVVDGREASGTGRTKRAAEKVAAADLLELLRG